MVRRRRPPRTGTIRAGALVRKLVLIALVNGFAMFAMQRELALGETGALVATLAATLAINGVYLSRRVVPLKYLVPGTIFMLLFIVYPVAYTVYISFTNYGTGNLLTKDQAIERLVANSLSTDADGARFAITPLDDGDGTMSLFMIAEDGSLLLGDESGLSPLAGSDITRDGNRVVSVDGRRALNLGQASQRQDELLDLVVPADFGEIRVQTLKQATVAAFGLSYDAASDEIVDISTGTRYRPREGRYTSDTGEVLTPGFRAVVGPDNYNRVWSNSAIRDPFIRVFAWNFAFALLSVALSMALGLGIALTLHRSGLKGVKFYRSLLIIPYAVPSFLSALVWQGMLNRNFGIINRMFHLDINWLLDPWWARFSVVLVNIWLGFPYMFLVCTGALQSIPSDLMEAAQIDGASASQRFRKVTWPLLLITLAPLLIASFAFNFNNFNTVFLLTGGGPPVPGSQTPAGATDILITYTFRLAFEGGRGQDFGFAAAISVMIFFVVATISAISFRRTKAFENLA